MLYKCGGPSARPDGSEFRYVDDVREDGKGFGVAVVTLLLVAE